MSILKMKMISYKIKTFAIILSIYLIIIFQINISIQNSLLSFNFAKRIVKSQHVLSENKKYFEKYKTDSTSQNILLIGDSMSKWLRY